MIQSCMCLSLLQLILHLDYNLTDILHDLKLVLNTDKATIVLFSKTHNPTLK